MAVYLSIAAGNASLPLAYRLYLHWRGGVAQDSARREKPPEEITFQPKPQIALDQIRQVAEQKSQGWGWLTWLKGNYSEFRTGSDLALGRRGAVLHDRLGTRQSQCCRIKDLLAALYYPE